MNIVLIRKILREHSGTLQASLVGLFAAEILIALAFRSFGKYFDKMMSMIPPAMINALYGGTLEGMQPANGFLMGGFVHPLVLVLLSSFAIAVASRSVAGEIESGTIDILLACPIPRGQLIRSAIGLTALGLGVLVTAIYSGAAFGAWLGGAANEVDFRLLAYLAINLYVMFLAVAGYSLFFSALASERGRAVAWSAGLTAGCWFVNVLAEIWETIKPLQPLSIFHYCRPQPIFVSHAPPTRDLLILMIVAAVGSVLATIVFQRRDIVTV